jgi:putative glutamine amidotransferase
MKNPPWILVAPNVEIHGDEFGDLSTTISETYQRAIIEAGGVPVSLAATISQQTIAEYVRHCDGVLLTGGEDVDPRIYGDGLPASVQRTVKVTEDGGARDLRELMLIDELFRQRKPVLAICRGHQVLNVALGGTLLADIPIQKPDALNHNRPDKRREVVHEVRLTAGGLLSKITGRQSMGVNSTHHQAVARVAEPLNIAALSNDGVIEGLELRPEAAKWLPFLLSVQFHPERLVDRFPFHRAIFRAFTQACLRSRNNNL